jgi:hypothetical protein
LHQGRDLICRDAASANGGFQFHRSGKPLPAYVAIDCAKAATAMQRKPAAMVALRIYFIVVSTPCCDFCS